MAKKKFPLHPEVFKYGDIVVVKDIPGPKMRVCWYSNCVDEDNGKNTSRVGVLWFNKNHDDKSNSYYVKDLEFANSKNSGVEVV